MQKQTTVHAERSFNRFGIDIWILQRDSQGKVSHIGKIEEDGSMMFYPHAIGALRPSPTFNISDGQAIDLISALTEVGTKTPDAGKVNGLYEAQSRHLEDMRAIVAKQLQAELK
jgi:hypothetical protein